MAKPLHTPNSLHHNMLWSPTSKVPREKLQASLLRQDQTRSQGGDGRDQKDGDHLLSSQVYHIIPVAYMLHQALQTIFDHKQRLSTATVYSLFY